MSIADASSITRTSAALNPQFRASISAATPATCGEAIDVPCACPYEPPGTDEAMLTPGATTSCSGP